MGCKHGLLVSARIAGMYYVCVLFFYCCIYFLQWAQIVLSQYKSLSGLQIYLTWDQTDGVQSIPLHKVL